MSVYKVQLGDTVTLYRADCLVVLSALEDNSVDAIVTDPPYGLSFMGKDWDHGIPGVVFWEAMLRVAKPGAMLLAFGGTRTHHRLMCAIEDAGWEIRDVIMWVYGSGFPKSLDVSKAIDKAAGSEREVVGESCTRLQLETHKEQSHGGWNGQPRTENGGVPITAPVTPEAQQWDGWGTALKPAWEPIIVARKPLEGTVAANVLRWGTGVINIDGCRIQTSSLVQKAAGAPGFGDGRDDGYKVGTGRQYTIQGRWPANVMHDGSDEVLAEFAKAGFKGQPGGYGKQAEYEGGDSVVDFTGKHSQGPLYFDAGNGGSAARFFYCAKASRAEREAGLDELDLVEPEGFDASDGGYNVRTWIDRKDGNGCVPVNARRVSRRNHHPTVKPLALMRWLCRLVTPPVGVVLDPFMGSGTTGVAAIKLGRRFIGIEIDEGYFEIAKKRITEALAQPLLPAFQPAPVDIPVQMEIECL